MANPKVIVLTGYGINCEEETAFAFEKAGAKSEIVHINDLIDGLKNLNDYQILAIPGGFSFGDDTGSGNAYANKLKNNLKEQILDFVKRQTLILGICNGCQILSLTGLIPATFGKYGEPQVAFRHNSTARYECRFVDVKANSEKCVFTRGLDVLHIPIAHGEGNFYAENSNLERLEENQQIPLKYSYSNGDLANGEFPLNPNGALLDTAAVCDESGRIMGIMPHPERAIFFTQSDLWTLEKEMRFRGGKELPEEGDGMAIFENAVGWF